jgi:hypothetical protein
VSTTLCRTGSAKRLSSDYTDAPAKSHNALVAHRPEGRRFIVEVAGRGRAGMLDLLRCGRAPQSCSLHVLIRILFDLRNAVVAAAPLIGAGILSHGADEIARTTLMLLHDLVVLTSPVVLPTSSSAIGTEKTPRDCGHAAE